MYSRDLLVAGFLDFALCAVYGLPLPALSVNLLAFSETASCAFFLVNMIAMSSTATTTYVRYRLMLSE